MRPLEGDPETTGHDWDGIREFNNPMPRWWLWTFYATVLWAIGYWILMPAWPLASSYTKGMLGYSQRETLKAEMQQAAAAQAQYAAAIARSDLETIRTDPELLSFALAGGRSAFAVNCSQCHGAGAEGAKGYPNLNDDFWLWGGTLPQIHKTIRFGVRSGREQAHDSAMPAFLRDEILTREQVRDVATYVLSLSGGAAGGEAATRGAAIFKDQCAACHGPDGKGKQEFGSPDLTDAIWLYGGDAATVVESISFSRRGVMPAWEGKLDAVTLKQLAVYVHSLGGGR
jgi:cytochrome c oxidase cbb3-type subunit 3